MKLVLAVLSQTSFHRCVDSYLPWTVFPMSGLALFPPISSLFWAFQERKMWWIFYGTRNSSQISPFPWYWLIIHSKLFRENSGWGFLSFRSVHQLESKLYSFEVRRCPSFYYLEYMCFDYTISHWGDASFINNANTVQTYWFVYNQVLFFFLLLKAIYKGLKKKDLKSFWKFREITKW